MFGGLVLLVLPNMPGSGHSRPMTWYFVLDGAIYIDISVVVR